MNRLGPVLAVSAALAFPAPALAADGVSGGDAGTAPDLYEQCMEHTFDPDICDDARDHADYVFEQCMNAGYARVDCLKAYDKAFVAVREYLACMEREDIPADECDEDPRLRPWEDWVSPTAAPQADNWNCTA